MIEIDTKMFFKVGIFCFGVGGAANLVNYIMFFSSMNIWSKIGNLTSVAFSFVTALFFLHLLKTSTPGLPQEIEPTSRQQLEEAFNNEP